MKINKIMLIMFAVGAVALLFPETGLANTGRIPTAKTVADMANQMIPQLNAVQIVMSGLSFIFGLILGFRGVLKLKEVNESKGKTSIVVPIVMLAASACFLCMPLVVNLGIDTFGFGFSGNETQFKYDASATY